MTVNNPKQKDIWKPLPIGCGGLFSDVSGMLWLGPVKMGSSTRAGEWSRDRNQDSSLEWQVIRKIQYDREIQSIFEGC